MADPTKIFYRECGQFVIDKNQLSDVAKNTATMNALYVAAYDEFKGAADHEIYGKLSPSDRIKKLNEFACKWLQDRGLL